MVFAFSGFKSPLPAPASVHIADHFCSSLDLAVDKCGTSPRAGIICPLPCYGNIKPDDHHWGAFRGAPGDATGVGSTAREPGTPSSPFCSTDTAARRRSTPFGCLLQATKKCGAQGASYSMEAPSLADCCRIIISRGRSIPHAAVRSHKRSYNRIVG